MLIESWKGHKITMKCVVKKAFANSTVRFSWRMSNGQLLYGREVYFKDRELSQMTVVTETDAQFNPVRCTAKTETTTQTLDIIIKRLREWLCLVVPHFPLPRFSPTAPGDLPPIHSSPHPKNIQRGQTVTGLTKSRNLLKTFLVIFHAFWSVAAISYLKRRSTCSQPVK